MSVITFWNNENEQTGKTMSLVAIATYMSIEHNAKTLIIPTTNKKDKIKPCFFEEEKKKKISLGIFGPNKNSIDIETGIKGIAKIMQSNKMTPQTITNYTNVVFKDRLEILENNEEKEDIKEIEKIENKKIEELYPELLKYAKKYYDKIFIDLDYNVDEKVRNEILEMSDIIIINLNQRRGSLNNFLKKKNENKLLNSPKTLLLIGRYDSYSKYNSKNISRYLGEKNQVLTIPYNTLFFEAAEEAGIPDLFLNYRRIKDTTDRNSNFITEVKRASENIIYRIQEIQANII